MIPAQVHTLQLHADVGAAFADTAASGPLLLALGAAALAGLVSFASPCVIPLVPGYISYLAVVALPGLRCCSLRASPWSSS